MRMIGSVPSFRFSRNPGLALVALLVVLLGAYQVAQLILADDLETIFMAGLIFVGGAIVVAILNDWRRGVYLFLAWVMFEDLIRKYLGNNMAIFFAKDFLVLILYLSFFTSRRANRVRIFSPPFLIPLLIFFWFSFIQVFNPQSTSVFYGLLGMKIYFLYVPLFFVGYSFLENDDDLRKIMTFNSILVMCVAGLGIAQSIIGPTFLNPRVLQDDIRDLSTLYRTAPISGLTAYRPTSVFVSTGRFSNFIMVSWVLVLGFGGYLLLRSRRSRLIAFLAIGTVGIAAIMSTSRSAIMWTGSGAMVMMAAFLWGAPWRQGEVRRVLRAIQRTLMVAGLALLLMITLFPEELGSRVAIYSETLSPDSPASELVYRARDYPLKNFLLAFQYDHWVTGYGIGTASLGTQYVMRIMHAAPMGVTVENGFGQIMLELGIVGLLMWIVLSAAIILSAWKVVQKLRGTPWFPMGFGIFWYSFLVLVPLSYIVFANYQDYVLNAYLWLFLGILFRLPELAAETAQTESAAQAASPPGQA
jgi:hypothetical protein